MFYAASSTIAILIGLFFVNLLSPGIADGIPVGEQLNLTLDSGEVASAVSAVEGRGGSDIVEIFLRMVPTNVVSAAAEGQMLGLIFFSLVFGFFMTQIPAKQSEVLITFWSGVSETMMMITMAVRVRYWPKYQSVNKCALIHLKVSKIRRIFCVWLDRTGNGIA